MSLITKAVIAAAGYGTRFLPATKNVPKELLPLINKPTIGYIVEQCVAAGIKDIIIVTRFGNHSIEDYFDADRGLETYLEKQGKLEALQDLKKIYSSANFVFVRQNPNVPYGNAAPIYSVKHLIKDEPFIFTFGDEFFLGKRGCIGELIDTYAKYPQADIILNAQQVDSQDVVHYGNLKIKKGTTDQVIDMIEKPTIKEAFSNLASMSPFLYTPKIFDYLYTATDRQANEVYHVPAIQRLLKDGGKAYVNITNKTWLDMGKPLQYLKSTVELALQDKDLRDDFIDFLHKRLNKEEI